MEKSFYDKLFKILPLYEGVKSAIILLENLDEKREMYIAPMNQLRSALDHLFKSIDIVHKTENCDYELQEVKEHLTRAGYDALDLLAGTLGTSAIQKLQMYDTDTITKLFPEYYTDVKPKITKIQQSIAQRRMERNIDTEKNFFAYFNEIKEFIQINTNIDRLIPSLQEYHNKKKVEMKKERLWTYFIGPLIGFCFASLIAILTWLLKK